MSLAKPEPPPSEDAAHAALVAGLARGDEAALGRLYEITLGKVYGFALRLTGKPESAEEVVGEVYSRPGGRPSASTRHAARSWPG